MNRHTNVYIVHNLFEMKDFNFSIIQNKQAEIHSFGEYAIMLILDLEMNQNPYREVKYGLLGRVRCRRWSENVQMGIMRINLSTEWWNYISF